MPVVRPCLAIACLVLCGCPAGAADTKPPPGQVLHVPPEEAMAILGAPVTGPDGKTVGRLVDVLVDAAGVPEAGVIDVGGFMGVGTRKIAVHWSALHFTPVDHARPITLDLTLDQIKAVPEYGNPAKPAPVVLPVQNSAAPTITPASASRATPQGAIAADTAPATNAARANPGEAATMAPLATTSGVLTPGADNAGAPNPGVDRPGPHGSVGNGANRAGATANGAPALGGVAPANAPSGSPLTAVPSPVQGLPPSAVQPTAKDHAADHNTPPTTQ